MLQILKLFYWAMKDPTDRLHLRYEFVRNLPGNYGFALRSSVLKPHFATVGDRVRVHVGARIRNVEKLALGEFVTLGVDNFIQAAGGVTIGDYSLLGPGVKVWSINHVFDDSEKLIREQGAEYKPVVIGRDVWIGSNAFIMPGTELGDGCIVAAGSVVGAKKYPPYSKLMGNPARVIGSRKKVVPESGDE
jgi:acetyltransferase-like isoleucine patch superfamily enzyme